MSEFFAWLGRFENSKVIALLLFFFTFCAILIYLFTGKERKKRLESYKYMPLDDDDIKGDASQTDSKVEKDE